jgi:hypothetical protein
MRKRPYIRGQRSEPDLYEGFVDHPRFGHRPRETGLDPDASWIPTAGNPRVEFHWHSSNISRIPNTAVTADCTKQIFASVTVTHYFDEVRVCQGCARRFIFFADEQKHWYEELGFSLEAKCTRCVPCRKKEQGTAKSRQRYEELFHIPKRTLDQSLAMAECCIELIETAHFSIRQTTRVRMLLNEAARASGSKGLTRRTRLLARLLALEEAALP